MRTSIGGLLIAILITGCGSDTTGDDARTASSSVATTARTTSQVPAKPGAALVGRWQLVRTCAAMVAALEAEHLGALAPGVVGEYFPGSTPQELARKRDLCAGAKPTKHSHFFDAQGQFGSLNEVGEQVDDGTYRATAGSFFLGEHGEEHFRYRIKGGGLTMHPVITRAQRRAALDHPLRFSAASHLVAVALAGSTWRRVPCDGYC